MRVRLEGMRRPSNKTHASPVLLRCPFLAFFFALCSRYGGGGGGLMERKLEGRRTSHIGLFTHERSAQRVRNVRTIALCSSTSLSIWQGKGTIKPSTTLACNARTCISYRLADETIDVDTEKTRVKDTRNVSP